MTTWLSKQPKAGLEALADQAGLQYSKSDNKATITSALDDHLRNNADKYRSVPSFSEYYRTSRSVSSAGEKRSRAGRATKTPTEIAGELIEETVAAVTPATPNQAAHRTPNRARASSASRISLPSTPAAISQWSHRQQLSLNRLWRKFYRDTGITDYLDATREALSTVPAIMMVFLAFELYTLNSVTMPWRHAFTLPAIAFIGPYRISVPDMFVVLTGTYWAPTALWLITSLIVPATVGWLINLSVAHEGRTTRRRQGYYTVDPLVFGLTKALTTWLVYSKGIRFGGLFEDSTVRSVEKSIPLGWFGIVIGSLIGVVASLYEAALRK